MMKKKKKNMENGAEKDWFLAPWIAPHLECLFSFSITKDTISNLVILPFTSEFWIAYPPSHPPSSPALYLSFFFTDLEPLVS